MNKIDKMELNIQTNVELSQKAYYKMIPKRNKKKYVDFSPSNTKHSPIAKEKSFSFTICGA